MDTQFDFNTLAKKRYSVRSYKDTPVSGNIIQYILEAARVAPTAKNNQPQRIIVIDSKESLSKLDKCTRCRYNAPLAFVVGYDKDKCYVRDADKKSSGDIDASIITTHMMLAATDVGLGSTWLMAFDPFILREEFSIPENINITAILVAGYPADDAAPSPRHALYRDDGEIITYNKI